MPDFSYSHELGCWTHHDNPSETITVQTKLRLKVMSVSLLQKSVVRSEHPHSMSYNHIRMILTIQLVIL